MKHLTESETTPQPLEELFSKIPFSYSRVTLARDGGFRFHAEKVMGGGDFKIITNSHPTVQEAFDELWSRL